MKLLHSYEVLENVIAFVNLALIMHRFQRIGGSRAATRGIPLTFF